jgi:hypothetical protein
MIDLAVSSFVIPAKAGIHRPTAVVFPPSAQKSACIDDGFPPSRE